MPRRRATFTHAEIARAAKAAKASGLELVIEPGGAMRLCEKGVVESKDSGEKPAPPIDQGREFRL